MNAEITSAAELRQHAQETLEQADRWCLINQLKGIIPREHCFDYIWGRAGEPDFYVLFKQRLAFDLLPEWVKQKERAKR